MDRDEDFVQKAGVVDTTSTACQSTRAFMPDLDRPVTERFNRFVGDVPASLSEQSLELRKAQTDSLIEPDSVTDDVWWKAMRF